MTPISSSTTIPFVDFRTVSSTQPVPNTVPAVDEFIVEQNLNRSVDPALLEQLPQGPAQGITEIFQSINTLAFQSAEIGQSVEEREDLQSDVDDDLDELRTLLDELAQEELQLFAAVFQNQVPEFSSGSSIAGDDSILEDFTLNDSTGNTLDSLFQIDITTEQGALSALDLATNILDTLSIFNTGSDFLESFLEDLSDFNFAFASIEGLSETEDTTEDTDTSESDTIAETETEEDEEEIIPFQETPPLVGPNGNPPTIIELSG